MVVMKMIETIEIPVATIYEESQMDCIRMCGFEVSKRNNVDRLRKQCMDVIADFYDKRIKSRIVYFDKMAIDDQIITIDGISIRCRILDKFSDRKISGGYLYIMTAPNTIEYEKVSDQFYADTCQTAFLNVARNWLMSYLLDDFYMKHNPCKEKAYISESLGPGYYGMEMSSVQSMYQILQGQEIGITLLDSQMMEPVKSNIGIYLLSDQSFSETIRDCRNCLGTSKTSCMFCKKNMESESE